MTSNARVILETFEWAHFVRLFSAQRVSYVPPAVPWRWGRPGVAVGPDLHFGQPRMGAIVVDLGGGWM